MHFLKNSLPVVFPWGNVRRRQQDIDFIRKYSLRNSQVWLQVTHASAAFNQNHPEHGCQRSRG